VNNIFLHSEKAGYFLIFIFLLVTLPIFSVTRTWDGDQDTDWSNVFNWDGDTTIPAADDDIVIPSTGVTFEPTLDMNVDIVRWDDYSDQCRGGF